MKEKRECKIVQDLFPSYIEKLTDEQTNEFIEEHLKTCESCKEKLECMKNDINVDLPKQKNKEINFLKKYKTKLRIFQYIVLAVLLAFVFVVGRRYVILTSLENKARNTINENNYYVKRTSQNSIMYPDDSSINTTTLSTYYMSVNEEYYKDGAILKYLDTYSLNDSKKFNNSISVIDYISATKCILLSNGQDDLTPVASIRLPAPNENNKDDRISPYTESLGNRLSDAFMYSIRETELLGKKCYVIRVDDWDNYIDAETGMLIREFNNKYNYIATYDYSFGTVTDEDIKEPDLSEYMVLDGRETQANISKDLGLDWYDKDAVNAYYEEKNKTENQIADNIEQD